MSPVDVVLLDLHLPGIDGSARRHPSVCEAGYRALVVSAAGTPEDVIDAIAAGAVGYLTKETDADEDHTKSHPDGVAGSGNTYVSPDLGVVPAPAAEKSASDYQLAKHEHGRAGPVGRRGTRFRTTRRSSSSCTTTVHSHLRARSADKHRTREAGRLHRLAHAPRDSPSEPDKRR